MPPTRSALLNYGYALLEAEVQLALRALGLDPGLGIIHTDQVNRDSLALDVMEPIRPTVDDLILRLLSVRRFKAADFHETPQGGCRLLPELTHELTGHLPHLRRDVAAHAEAAASVLTQASPGRVELRTPLTRSQSRDAQVEPQPGNVRTSSSKRPTATCRTCGEPLSHPTRQLCPQCWNVTRRELATQRSAKANESLAAMRARGYDPTNSADASLKRAATLSARKQEQLAWQPTADEMSRTSNWYQAEVLPGLPSLPLSAITRATGLSVSAASRIRAGKLHPHERHWEALRALVTD